jgi:hypothetical protein
MDKYTTTEIKSKIDQKDIILVANEDKKVLISNGEYALVEALNNLTRAIEARVI